MTLFRTSPMQVLMATHHAVAMEATGLPPDFIARVLGLAQQDQGAFELLELWVEADSLAERAAVIADLQELLDEAVGE